MAHLARGVGSSARVYGVLIPMVLTGVAVTVFGSTSALVVGSFTRLN
jgi:hypothetical protein